ncbi:hypothetical protein FNH22_22615 [Fulvivirga sp. M361]|nr:hypothetical protein FNH22_22615 [Fulvivirga sp. M361]
MTPRFLMIAAVVLLAGVFLFPLWQITLEAAQFPGGLRLNIWINKFSGDEGGGDIIKNINILNHYIGMKYIEPDSIAELKYFPFIVYGMMTLGLVTVFLNKTWAYATWLIIMSVLGILGVYDFYLWMYDYGHNLDPNAPIKIEGMTYMPPLFGEKDLLNFYVKSYPRMGTIFLTISIVFSFLATWFRKKQQKDARI